MPEKRLVLHVGPHKTGSTSLQYGLLKSQKTLNELGFTYPEMGLEQFAHHRIYTMLNNPDKSVGAAFLDGLTKSVGDADTVILSSEDFIYLPEFRLQELKRAFVGYRIEIVIFIRSPVDLWPSHWQELIKHGWTHTLLEYIGSYSGWTDTIDASIMNPFVQASKFARVFGRDSIRMFSYDNMVDSKKDIYDVFWTNILGISAAPPIVERRKLNESLNGTMIEVLRSLNEHHQSISGAKPSNFVISRYQPQRAAIEDTAGYKEFARAFEAHAVTLNLDNTQELFRNRERMLINNFGSRIENKAAADQLNTRQVFKRKITYARSYWTYRFGLQGWVEDVLRQITQTETVS